MKPTALLTNPIDNVATVVRDISKNEKITYLLYEDLKTVAANASIPIYHKIALCAIPSGSDVIKYGQVIGMATSDIIKGDWVHVHNVESKRGRGDLK